MPAKFFSILFACSVAFVSCKPSPSVIEEEKQPNLLFIFPDQLRNAAIGANQEDPVVTPNIDQLVAEGLTFNNALSNYPLCSPYRGMLMTGKLPYNNTVISNCNSKRYASNNNWQKKDTCFSDVLVQNGYEAGYVGKLHLTSPKPKKGVTETIWNAYTPKDKRHGFSFWYSYGAEDKHMNPSYWINDAKEDELFYPNKFSAQYESEVIIDYINNKGKVRDPKKPFALFWSVNPPHPPYDTFPKEWLDIYNNKSNQDLLNRHNVNFENIPEEISTHVGATKNKSHLSKKHAKDYFAMVHAVDHYIGEVLKALRENGLEENTIVVISSDHGEMMGSHGLMSKNIWFDEAVNIPFIIKWPKKIKANTRTDAFLSVTDVMPSILNLMKANKGMPKTDGKDLSNILLDPKTEGPKHGLYYYMPTGEAQKGYRGFVSEAYTFAITIDKNKKVDKFLYNNKKDPFQIKNCIKEEAHQAKIIEEQMIEDLNKKKDPWLAYYQSINEL